MAPLHAALAGRDRELGVLTDRFEAARHGRPSLVVLSGEAGIGKSRLVEEFLAAARTDGALVAVGYCVQSGTTSLPYAPYLDVLADLGREAGDLAERLPAPVRRSIAPLTGDPGTEGGWAGGDLALPRMFAGVTETVALLSRERPVVLVLEDVHWGDPSSLDLTDFLVRRLGAHRVLVVATVRSNDRRADPASRSGLAELLRLPQTHDLALDPLPDDAIDQLLDALPEPPAGPARERIRRLSEGNPFYAQHLATRRDRDELVSPALRDSLVPVGELDAPDREALVLLAVLGRTVPAALLAGALGWTGGALDACLRSLVELGLVQTRAADVGLRHALVREALLDSVLPSERVLAHFRAATGLLAGGAAAEAERAEELAIHLLGCGRHAEAIGFALRGARHAASAWAFADAGRLYASVQRLWPVVAAADPARAELPDLVDVLAEHAIASRWAGALDDALAQLDRADGLDGLTGEQLARLAYTRGLVLWAAGDVEGSLHAYEAADRRLDGTDAPLRVTALAALAGAQMMSGRSAEARGTAERAIESARLVEAVNEELHATITLAAALAQQGEHVRAVALLERCLPVARERDELEIVMRCYGNLTFVLHSAGRYADVERVAREGEEVCRRYGPMLSVASTVVNNHVAALVNLGRWDEARELGAQALDDAIPAGIALSLHQTLAEIGALQGDADVLEHHLARAADLSSNNPYARSSELTARAEGRLWAGDAAAALALVEESLTVLAGQDDAGLVLNACWLGLRAVADDRVAARPADEAAVVRLLELAHRTAAGSTAPSVTAVLTLCAAEAARAVGRDDDADWSVAAEANGGLHRPYHHAYALYRLAAGQLRRRALTAVVPTLREARAAADALGCRPLLAGIDELVTVGDVDLGPPPAVEPPAAEEPDGPADPYGLTPREREVLTLIAGGATNRRVARALFISERTAGVHVGNILAKLGVANRTEAAMVAHRIGLAPTASPDPSTDAAAAAAATR